MPPMPIYMCNGISFSVAIISLCILTTRAGKHHLFTRMLINTGKLALTFYVIHVVLGMGLAEILSPVELGAHSIEFSVVYALIFCLYCILFADYWLTYKKIGPLEWLMRKLTD